MDVDLIKKLALLMLEQAKEEYKHFYAIEQENKKLGIVDKNLNDYLEYLRSADGLKFDKDGKLIE